MSNIRNQLLCVGFSISCWEARRQDKKATKEVAQAHGTDAAVGRYHKDLLPGATEHEDIIKLRNAWRVWHYENTLPWGQDGTRVLRSSSFLDYGAEFSNWKSRFEALCEALYAAYPTLVAQAELRLNTLFDANDYPKVEEVRRRFAVRMNVSTMPNADDFRIIDGIPADQAEQLRIEAVSGLEEQVQAALKDLSGRMYAAVSAMQARLEIAPGEKGAKFHDSLVENIRELIKRIPKLNLTDDKEIIALSAEMEELVAHSPLTLREDPLVRNQTADKARALAARMATYIGE